MKMDHTRGTVVAENIVEPDHKQTENHLIDDNETDSHPERDSEHLPSQDMLVKKSKILGNILLHQSGSLVCSAVHLKVISP